MLSAIHVVDPLLPNFNFLLIDLRRGPSLPAHMISALHSTHQRQPPAIVEKVYRKSSFKLQVRFPLSKQSIFHCKSTRIVISPRFPAFVGPGWPSAAPTRHVFGHVLHMTSTLDPAAPSIESKELPHFSPPCESSMKIPSLACTPAVRSAPM